MQQRLADNDIPKPASPRIAHEPLLAGLLRDDAGGTMGPVHTVKNGRRYHYYVTLSARARRSGAVGSLPRISAPVLDDLVIDKAGGHLARSWMPGSRIAPRLRAALLNVELGEASVIFRFRPEALAHGSDATLILSIRLKSRGCKLAFPDGLSAGHKSSR